MGVRVRDLINKWLKKSPSEQTGASVEVGSINSIKEISGRESLSSLLSYEYFDHRNNLLFTKDGKTKSIGFLLGCNPLMVAGVDAEPNLEAIFSSLPADSIVQFGKLVTPQIEGFLTQWEQARLEKNTNPLLVQITKRRKDFMMKTSGAPSMLPNTKLHPRMTHFYVAVKIPYKGDIKDNVELGMFIKQVIDCRGTVQGGLTAAMMSSAIMKEDEVKFLIRELLNPHLDPSSRLLKQSASNSLAEDAVDKQTRITVDDSGRILFSSGLNAPTVAASVITVDRAPKYLYLPMMARTLGNPVAWDERITCPYWAFTNIHILHPDNARDDLLTTVGMLNKQTMSESAWFKSMMGHLFERKDRAADLLRQTEDGHNLVRAYSGIVLYTAPDDAKNQIEYVRGLYRRAGFRASDEKNIGLPSFVAALPFIYDPQMDPVNKGLQRAWLMNSLNAAAMLQVQGDWWGTPVEKGGILLTSRQGQLATFDLLTTTTNYNFVVVAASGSGKSFLTNEIVADFLSRGGIARIIDVGRSYARFCSIMGGENIVFSPENPLSINPFTGIDTEQQLNELMPMLKDLLRLMAYPLTTEQDTPPYQYQLFEKAIREAWLKYQDDCELRHVVEWLRDYTDASDAAARASDLALQLEPYSHGRYKRWFTGRRTVSFNNALVVIELEELNQDTALQAVVLQIVMFQVTKEMYLSGREKPKVLAIDEAWALMGEMKTGKFIETAFRRMRKYNGIAGVITQSFEDFEKSPASKAAIENAEWQFILAQRGESIDFAAANKRISTDENTLELLKSVKSGPGFSEVFVRGGSGQAGLYRFISDRHTYYTFTTNPKDTVRIDDLVKGGKSIEEAIDILATQDYNRMWSKYDRA